MDERLEAKLGFDRVRAAIQARCSTEYAALRTQEEEFSTDAEEIHRRHLLADEMRLILMFEENFPTSGYIDAIGFLEPVGKNASIDLLSLGKLRTLLETLRKALHFFHSVKEGIYPNLQHLCAGISAPADVSRRIDAILDRHGEIKDTASDELYSIRRSIRGLLQQARDRAALTQAGRHSPLRIQIIRAIRIHHQQNAAVICAESVSAILIECLCISLPAHAVIALRRVDHNICAVMGKQETRLPFQGLCFVPGKQASRIYDSGHLRQLLLPDPYRLLFNSRVP